MAIILRADQIDKTYPLGKGKTQQILRKVSLTVEAGEFLSIMGPSGSGKSTLLYSISGMDRPTGGVVTFDGQDIGTLSETELANVRLTRMGFVFQQSSLLRNLSILDNIVVSAYLGARGKRNAINQRALGLMQKTGIEHLKDNDVTQASGGELQRAAICRALINQPDILFGDEPTGALNSSATAEVMDILSGIHAEGGTILLVTHDARVAARSDRVLFMTDGEIRGEMVLGRYRREAEEWKGREARLSEWLGERGF